MLHITFDMKSKPTKMESNVPYENTRSSDIRWV